MAETLSDDPFFLKLCEGLSEIEVVELRRYLVEWLPGSYTSLSHNVFDHALRKEMNPLRYLRKAHNFKKKGARRVPKNGYRSDASAVYRKGSEYLIVRIDPTGSEKIVTYGINDD